MYIKILHICTTTLQRNYTTTCLWTDRVFRNVGI